MDNHSDYDDIYLIPKQGCSSINSRTEVDLKTNFYGLYPIISSPMKAISGVNLVIEMAKNNCLGILHRFDTPEQRIKNIHAIAKENVKFGIAIGVHDFLTELDIASCAFEKGAVLICVDCANGYMEQLYGIGEKLVSRFGTEIALMSGNIVTRQGAEHLKNCGYDFVRVGIGGSKVCTTRTMTGVGRNNLSAIYDCKWANKYIVADGGVNEPGKAVKSFAVGADFVMMGSALAYADESEGTDTIYGMASEKLHREEGKLIKSIEGMEIKIDVDKKRPLREIIEQYLWCIRSACTILGCAHYNQIYDRAKIVLANENQFV